MKLVEKLDYILNTINDYNGTSAADIINVFNSKLFDFILSAYKWNGFNDVTVLKNLPYLDLSRSWTDEQLYSYFNLTQEEINLIEETVK